MGSSTFRAATGLTLLASTAACSVPVPVGSDFGKAIEGIIEVSEATVALADGLSRISGGYTVAPEASANVSDPDMAEPLM